MNPSVASKAASQEDDDEGVDLAAMLSPHAELAAWLLRQRSLGASSPWAPYISSLPEYVPLPIRFPHWLLNRTEAPDLIGVVSWACGAYRAPRCKPQCTMWHGLKANHSVWASFGVIS